MRGTLRRPVSRRHRTERERWSFAVEDAALPSDDMAGERLTIEVNGNPQLAIDVQGNLGGTGWRGTAFDVEPATSWSEGDDVSVVVLDPPSHRDKRATAQVTVAGGSIVFVGTSGFHW